MVTADAEAQMGDWAMIGVPSSAGAHHAGQERAPDALRAAGLAARLAAAGESVQDLGNLPEAPFAVDHRHPGARNLDAVARVAREVADAVADVAGAGRLPLVVGGDCTITLGVIAGFRRSHPDVRLVYVDGDADVGLPDSGGSGIFDSMGVSHLLGRGARELAGLGGAVPLLEGARLAIVGADPRETDDAGRAYLSAAGGAGRDRDGSGPAASGELAGEVVEVAVPGAGEKRGELGAGADQRGPGRVAGVADRDGAAGQFGDLDAVPAGVAVAALAPGRMLEAGVLGAGGGRVPPGVLFAARGAPPSPRRVRRARPRPAAPAPGMSRRPP